MQSASNQHVFTEFALSEYRRLVEPSRELKAVFPTIQKAWLVGLLGEESPYRPLRLIVESGNQHFRLIDIDPNGSGWRHLIIDDIKQAFRLPEGTSIQLATSDHSIVLDNSTPFDVLAFNANARFIVEKIDDASKELGYSTSRPMPPQSIVDDTDDGFGGYDEDDSDEDDDTGKDHVYRHKASSPSSQPSVFDEEEAENVPGGRISMTDFNVCATAFLRGVLQTVSEENDPQTLKRVIHDQPFAMVFVNDAYKRVEFTFKGESMTMQHALSAYHHANIGYFVYRARQVVQRATASLVDELSKINHASAGEHRAYILDNVVDAFAPIMHIKVKEEEVVVSSDANEPPIILLHTEDSGDLRKLAPVSAEEEQKQEEWIDDGFGEFDNDDDDDSSDEDASGADRSKNTGEVTHDVVPAKSQSANPAAVGNASNDRYSKILEEEGEDTHDVVPSKSSSVSPFGFGDSSDEENFDFGDPVLPPKAQASPSTQGSAGITSNDESTAASSSTSSEHDAGNVVYFDDGFGAETDDEWTSDDPLTVANDEFGTVDKESIEGKVREVGRVFGNVFSQSRYVTFTPVRARSRVVDALKTEVFPGNMVNIHVKARGSGRKGPDFVYVRVAEISNADSKNGKGEARYCSTFKLLRLGHAYSIPWVVPIKEGVIRFTVWLPLKGGIHDALAKTGKSVDFVCKRIGDDVGTPTTWKSYNQVLSSGDQDLRSRLHVTQEISNGRIAGFFPLPQASEGRVSFSLTRDSLDEKNEWRRQISAEQASIKSFVNEYRQLAEAKKLRIHRAIYFVHEFETTGGAIPDDSHAALFNSDSNVELGAHSEDYAANAQVLPIGTSVTTLLASYFSSVDALGFSESANMVDPVVDAAGDYSAQPIDGVHDYILAISSDEPRKPVPTRNDDDAHAERFTVVSDSDKSTEPMPVYSSSLYPVFEGTFTSWEPVEAVPSSSAFEPDPSTLNDKKNELERNYDNIFIIVKTNDDAKKNVEERAKTMKKTTDKLWKDLQEENEPKQRKEMIQHLFQYVDRSAVLLGLAQAHVKQLKDVIINAEAAETSATEAAKAAAGSAKRATEAEAAAANAVATIIKLIKEAEDDATKDKTSARELEKLLMEAEENTAKGGAITVEDAAKNATTAESTANTAAAAATKSANEAKNATEITAAEQATKDARQAAREAERAARTAKSEAEAAEEALRRVNASVSRASTNAREIKEKALRIKDDEKAVADAEKTRAETAKSRATKAVETASKSVLEARKTIQIAEDAAADAADAANAANAAATAKEERAKALAEEENRAVGDAQDKARVLSAATNERRAAEQKEKEETEGSSTEHERAAGEARNAEALAKGESEMATSASTEAGIAASKAKDEATKARKAATSAATAAENAAKSSNEAKRMTALTETSADAANAAAALAAREAEAAENATEAGEVKQAADNAEAAASDAEQAEEEARKAYTSALAAQEAAQEAVRTAKEAAEVAEKSVDERDESKAIASRIGRRCMKVTAGLEASFRSSPPLSGRRRPASGIPSLEVVEKVKAAVLNTPSISPATPRTISTVVVSLNDSYFSGQRTMEQMLISSTDSTNFLTDEVDEHRTFPVYMRGVRESGLFIKTEVNTLSSPFQAMLYESSSDDGEGIRRVIVDHAPAYFLKDSKGNSFIIVFVASAK